MNLKTGIQRFFPVLIFSLAAFSSALAGEVTLPNTFTAGTPAVAAEVNANFTAVKTAVDDNDSRVAALETLVAALQSRLAALESSQVMALESYLTVDETTDPRGPLVQLSGLNLQIVNGLGGTNTVNGLGNLIVGYDEINAGGVFHCSNGELTDQATCEAYPAVWSDTLKSGSHYLVLGTENNYSQYGGFVAGRRNWVNRAYGTVSGGFSNLASGEYSSVSGGVNNTASGQDSSISGGNDGIASGAVSSISGGGGNTASASRASISGGSNNTASGMFSSVSGGFVNTAAGENSSVSGGNSRTAAATLDWAAGSLWEDE